jgi:hypothetical protein
MEWKITRMKLYFFNITLIIAKKLYTMPRKKQSPGPAEIPAKKSSPKIKPGEEPEYPVLPEEEPDIIPDEDPFETPPYEIPEPGEGP